MQPRNSRDLDTKCADPADEEDLWRLIREHQDSYALRRSRDGPSFSGAKQLAIPFTGAARAIPAQFLPIDPLDLLRGFFREARIIAMKSPVYTKTSELVVAFSDWGVDPHGSARPVIQVRPEDFQVADPPETEDQITSSGRFAAFRELARLLIDPDHSVGSTAELPRDRASVRVNPGDYIGQGFFDCPLNRLAMVLGCPRMEFERTLRGSWGGIPVTREMLRRNRPMFTDEKFGLERVFFEHEYEGRLIEDLLGLDRHALLAWGRYMGSVEF